MPWRRKWQPTPVFLPGEFHGQRSLAGYSPWGHKRVRHNLVTKQQQQQHTLIKVAKTIKRYFFLNSHQEGSLKSRERRFPRQCIKKQRHHFPNKGPSSQGSVFPVVMYGCESSTIKKAGHQRIDAFKLWCWIKHSWESLGQKEIKPINPKENQSWMFIGRTDAEAETLILWPPDAELTTWKHPGAGKDWRQEKGVTEDETVG